MDFLAKEIFYLFWFSSLLGTIGGTVMGSVNQAVLVGTENVKINCTSADSNGNLIKWSLTPVIGSEKPIKDSAGIKDTKAYSGDEDGKSYSLNIIKATASTAGTYTCDDGKGKYRMLLIVLKPTCGYSPNPTRTLPCDTILTLSCDVEYFIDHALVTPSLTWSSDPETPLNPKEPTSPSTSTLEVTWPTLGDIPIYTCDIAFKMIDSALPSAMAVKPPADVHLCQPFDSPSIVTCGGKDDGGGGGGKDDPKNAGEAGKSGQKDSSARSAETNNLAIRVLGVAGVLLLAQVL